MTDTFLHHVLAVQHPVRHAAAIAVQPGPQLGYQARDVGLG